MIFMSNKYVNVNNHSTTNQITDVHKLCNTHHIKHDISHTNSRCE